jgi:hypothetical protein
MARKSSITQEDSTRARDARLEDVRIRIAQGERVGQIKRDVATAYGVSRATVRRDLTEIGREVRRQLSDAGVLDAERGEVLDRLRALSRDEDGKVALKATEALWRILDERAAEVRLGELGVEVERHKAELIQLKQAKEEARVDLAQAQAELARAQRDRAAAPLVVIIRDLAGDLDDEDFLCSPTVNA